MHVLVLEELIFVFRPTSAGMNLLHMIAGLCSFSRPAMSRVMRKYGSWSTAQGIRQRIFFWPSTFGNDEENAGDAWMAGNACCPMLEVSLKPKMARA